MTQTSAAVSVLDSSWFGRNIVWVGLMVGRKYELKCVPLCRVAAKHLQFIWENIAKWIFQQGKVEEKGGRGQMPLYPSVFSSSQMHIWLSWPLHMFCAIWVARETNSWNMSTHSGSFNLEIIQLLLMVVPGGKGEKMDHHIDSKRNSTCQMIAEKADYFDRIWKPGDDKWQTHSRSFIETPFVWTRILSDKSLNILSFPRRKFFNLF